MRTWCSIGFLAILALALTSCSAAEWTLPVEAQAQTAPGASRVEAVALAVASSTLAGPVPAVGTLEPAYPLETPAPRAPRYYRSYPAPTGQPGFRRYYQIRCYPGCHTAVTPAVPPAKATAQVLSERARVHRSYPAPTGQAGFRRYYQIRCYPGCHSFPSATPVATQVHP
jgi:hypothetical protein